MMDVALPPPALAFDSIAESFDARYGEWRSVAAQRRAVRARLLAAFPAGARVLEVGGGTGEDAHWLARRGREVLMTDASPAMVQVAERKLSAVESASARVAAAEELDRIEEGGFDGAFSNFAALNCVTELGRFARGVARKLRPGAPLLLVVFGPLPPGEVAVQLARGDARAAFRRLSRGPVAARLGGREFCVRYHRSGEIARALAPWFRRVERRGIGVFVPPSAAEPWISRHPRLLDVLERADRVASRPLALLGDHVLHHLERTTESAPEWEQ
jgi:ubiquinone/menaquinone biosynthesis C-methylase UbiE